MAMTWTAKAGPSGIRQEIATKIDRPTPMTLRASRYKPANIDRTEYDVFVQDEASKGTPPSKYLRALVTGGYRANKRHETLLRSKDILPPGWQVQPGADAAKDAYGNLKGGGPRYVQILSGLKAFNSSGANLNRSAASQKRRASSLKDYFVLYSLKTKTPTGVYTRKGKRDVAQILAFTPKRSKYRKMLAFTETIDGIFSEKFEEYFREGLERMLIKVQKW